MMTTPTQNKKSLFILTAILVLVAVIQAQNMFHYPYLQDSEGTNISNGWTLVTEGNLSPYTYAYEEPPAGTIMLAGWSVMSNALSQFGTFIDSGRVLMLILHVLTAALIYIIALKLTQSDLAGIAATLVFALSPLAATLQRSVLLDNIMVVWFLLSLSLVLGEHRTLKHYLLSAMFFSLAVLSKGSAIFFLPAFVYTVRLRAHKHHWRFAANLWFTLAILLMSFFPLYAQMKEELFPQGWFLGGNFPHVSLLERLADRGPETGTFWNMGSGLSVAIDQWVNIEHANADPILIYGGLICAAFVLIMAIDNKQLRVIIAMILALVFKLIIGGPVFTSDIVPLLPLLAVCVGVVVGSLARALTRPVKSGFVRFAFATVTALVMLYPFGIFDANRLSLYTVNQVQGQVDAVNWLKEHIPANSVVVTDNYAFSELRETFPNAHYYWKVDTDPAIKFNYLDNDWCQIGYILSTPQVLADINLYHLDLLKTAYDNSELLVTYPNNGWPVEIRRVSGANCVTDIVAGNIPRETMPAS
jgi:4-amino-4-deoxy-L-arabinose transferase-like glycosyltransferase